MQYWVNFTYEANFNYFTRDTFSIEMHDEKDFEPAIKDLADNIRWDMERHYISADFKIPTRMSVDIIAADHPDGLHPRDVENILLKKQIKALTNALARDE